MQKNDLGQIAISYYQTIPHVVGVNKTEYAFTVKRAICMAWINPEHVEKILAIKNCNCQGGASKYRYASDAQVRIWTGVAER